jgi:tripartite-type tricarboxylate transporter receptor subunit TctC
MFAPAKTPGAIINRLNAEVGRYLRSAAAQAVFLRAGIDPSPSTPDELVEIINGEISRMSKVLKAGKSP